MTCFAVQVRCARRLLCARLLLSRREPVRGARIPVRGRQRLSPVQFASQSSPLRCRRAVLVVWSFVCDGIVGSQIVAVCGTALCGLAEKCPTLCFVSEPVLVLLSLRVVLCLRTEVGLAKSRLHDVKSRWFRRRVASFFRPAVGSQVGRDRRYVDGPNGRG